MRGPPVVMSRGGPVGRAFDVAIIGLFELTWPVTAPPVSPVFFYLVVEIVVHLVRREFSTEQAS